MESPKKRRSQSFSDLRDYRREGIVLDDFDKASEVYLNTYNYYPKFNIIGEKLGVPAYHSAVKFRGPLWPGSGREIEIAANNNGMNYFNEERASGPKNYDLVESRYMGLTEMRPQSIREYVGLLPPRRRKLSLDSLMAENVAKTAESIGHKYKHYHVTSANCNQAAEDILMKTLQRAPPKRNNRLAKKIGKITHVDNLPLHKLGLGLG